MRRLSNLLTSLNISDRRFSSNSHKFSFHFSKGLSVHVGHHTQLATTSILGRCTRRQLTSLFCLCKRLGGTHGVTTYIIGTHSAGHVRAARRLVTIIGPLFKHSHRGGRLTGIFRTLHVRIGRRVSTLGRVLRTTTRLLQPKNELIILACRSLRSHLIGGLVGANGLRKGTIRSLFKGMSYPFHTIGGGMVVPSRRRRRHGPHDHDTGLQMTRQGWRARV